MEYQPKQISSDQKRVQEISGGPNLYSFSVRWLAIQYSQVKASKNLKRRGM